MLINRSILDLIHLVKLAFEKDKLLSCVRLGVDDALLVLLESVHDLKEVTLGQEEFKVFRIASVCII